MRHDLMECPQGAKCLCDCFSSEIFDEIDARAKKSNLQAHEVADAVMTLGLAVTKMLETRVLPSGTKLAAKSKLSGKGL